MELLLYKDLIINFISQNLEDENHQRLIGKIFANEDSLFVYSRKFLEFIRDALGEEFSDEFNALFTKFSDYGLNIKSSDHSTSFDEELLHIYGNFPNNVILAISYQKPSEPILKEIPNIGVISQSEKPNYHWLVTQLAVLHPNKVTVSCLDFANNLEIKQFFDDVFRIPKFISRMNIFDRQTSLFNHDKFNSFKGTTSVYYFTYQHQNFIYDERIIKSTFRRIKIHTTRNNTHIHSRKLIFEGFVLTSHHDFNELLVGGDWEIDILFSKSEANRWIARSNSRFREYR